MSFRSPELHPAPTLYLICGLPAADKTTLAKRLEKEKQALRLSPDEWIAPLLNDISSQAEIDRFRPAVDTLQWNLARRLFRFDVSIVMEKGFWAREERLSYRAQAKALGARVELYVLDVPKEKLWQRLNARNTNLSFGTFRVTKEDLDLYCSWFELPQPDELGHYDDVHLIT